MKSKVLLFGWDAADWKVIDALIEQGEMPVLARFIEQGVMGDVSTLQPILSPMLWNSIATGKRADKHRILGFTEVAPNGNVRPVTSTSRKVKALWNIATQTGLRTHVVGWFGGHPAEPINGGCVSEMFPMATAAPGDPWPVMPGTIYPERLKETLADLRVRPDEVTGGMLQLFVPLAHKVDQEKDRRLAVLAKLQAECFSLHAAATYLLEHEPWDFSAIYYPSIDHFSHAFMAYHPPRMEPVKEGDFELYNDVVNGAYRLHDLMLGRILHLAGPDTTVMILSDHGFHSDHLRPPGTPRIPAGPAIWHRPHGIFCLRGENVRRDERIYGASLLDITPTVLTLLGLPVGQDMEGRVLLEAFEEPPAVEFIPSWEEVAGESGMHPPGTELAEDQSSALLEQFVALGYIDPVDENRERAAANCRHEQNWNLARVYLESSRYGEALELLEQLHFALPERGDIALVLARCQARLGLLDEAEKTIVPLVDATGGAPFSLLMRGQIAYERGHFDQSLQLLLEASRADPRLPDLHLSLGSTYLRMHSYPEAERAFQRAVEIDPHHPQGRQGLAAALLRQRRYDEAAGAALLAVGLQHHLPFAHYYLGAALVRLGLRERAIQAFETAASQNPPVPLAHRWLARLYDEQGDQERAARHQQVARQANERRAHMRARLKQVRAAAAQRAADRPPPPPVDAKIEPCSPRTFFIVSGLPRSGTSLMMQMLAAGGLEPMTDRERAADEDNPEGYYEWEAIKRIGKNPGALAEADGKVIKVITALIPALPPQNRYRVVFMNRPISEVAASQKKMIARRGTRGADLPPEKLIATLEQHREMILNGLRHAPNFDLLEINYPDLIAQPAAAARQVREFLALDLDEPAMAACVKPELHRNRASALAASSEHA